MILYAATSNPGKLREFTQTAADQNIEVFALPGLDTIPAPEEDAPDFMGNAALKAIYYSHLAPGLLVFADDSGLEVDALGGDPGVYSARFAEKMNFEPNSSLTKDERNNRCLLSMLCDVNTATRRPRRPPRPLRLRTRPRPRRPGPPPRVWRSRRRDPRQPRAAPTASATTRSSSSRNSARPWPNSARKPNGPSATEAERSAPSCTTSKASRPLRRASSAASKSHKLVDKRTQPPTFA